MLSKTLQRVDGFLEANHVFVLTEIKTPNNCALLLQGESRLIFDATHTPIALQSDEKEFIVRSTAGKWGRETFETLKKATKATGVLDRYNRRTNCLRIRLAFEGSEQFTERETITCRTYTFTLVDPLSFSITGDETCTGKIICRRP